MTDSCINDDVLFRGHSLSTYTPNPLAAAFHPPNANMNARPTPAHLSPSSGAPLPPSMPSSLPPWASLPPLSLPPLSLPPLSLPPLSLPPLSLPLPSSSSSSSASSPPPPAEIVGLKHDGWEATSGAFDFFFDDDGDDSGPGCFRRGGIPRWAAPPPPATRTMPTSRGAKISETKRRGGGSWLLGFAATVEPPLSSASSSSSLSSSSSPPPGLLRSTSGTSLDTYDLDDSSSASSSSSPKANKRKGVSFNEDVSVRRVSCASDLSSRQRRKIYSDAREVRDNKIRNKKEYRFDNCDWRNATEEWEMPVCAVTGDLVHPAHVMLPNWSTC